MNGAQDATSLGNDRWDLLSALLAVDQFMNQFEIILCVRSPLISGNALRNPHCIHNLLKNHSFGEKAKSSPLASDAHLKPLEAVREEDVRIPYIHLYER